MEKLLITGAKYRTVRGISQRTIASRFLRELPSEHVTMVDLADSSGASDDRDEFDDWGDRVSERLAGARHGQRTPREDPRDLASGLRVGGMVRHPQFGVGKVLSLTRGADARAQIAFRDVGVKTLVLSYARLERLSER
jgi:DNA helicase-2/ATP-dependent DNA helicase PcrA